MKIREMRASFHTTSLKLILLVLLSLAAISPALQAATPFTVTLPNGFTGQANATQGPLEMFGYTRPTVEPDMRTLFQVNVITLTPEGKAAGLEKMLDGMIGGIERRRIEFKKSSFLKGTLGGEESLFVDWTGVHRGHALKGRMICAVSNNRLYCVHFQDLAGSWEKSLPEAEKALQTFAFSK